MPDLNPGTTVRGLDTPPMVFDEQADSFTFTITAFGVATTGGTYVTCGVVFEAPTSGRVLIHYAANLDNSTAASTNVAPHVREGSTIGSGADVLVADLEHALRHIGTDDATFGSFVAVDGLTPGDEYNVRLEHRVNAGTGTVQYRRVAVVPTS